MSNKTRKRIWPVSLAAVIGVVATLAMLAVTVWMPGTAQAQAPFAGPANLEATADSDTEISLTWDAGLGQTAYEVERRGGPGMPPPPGFTSISTTITGTTYTDRGLTADTSYTYRVRGVNSAGESAWSNEVSATTMAAAGTGGDDMMAGAVSIDGFSSSPSGKADLTITIDTDKTGSLPIGSKVVLYLDDKFQVQDPVPSGTVNFVSYMSPSSGSPRTASVKVDDGDSDQLGEDAWAIIATVPNMATDDNPEGIAVGDDLALVIDEAAGVKSPTEAGDYKYGYQVIRPGGASMDFDMVMGVMEHTVDAKVGLNDENNKRGFELVITGTGFNSGSSATAYVLKDQSEAPASCQALIGHEDSESIGTETVSDTHQVVIEAEVTGGSKGDFSAGKTNYICIRDDNSPTRRLSIDTDPFDLQHSIAVEPADAVSGEEVTIKLRDYPKGYQVERVVLDGKKFWYRVDPVDDPSTTNVNEGRSDDFDVSPNGSELTFEMPGGVSSDVEVSVIATVPDGDDDDTDRDSISSKQATITVNPSSLDLSQSEVAPNASIIISGSGFNKDGLIAVENITIDDEQLVVDDAGTVNCDVSIGPNRKSKECVQVTSSGEFTATVRVWTHEDSDENPALDDDDFTIKVKDQDGFEGKATVTIKSATVTVTPETASPRDFIVISGENWPISTPELDNSVTIKVDNRSRQADVDSTGRFRYEYQLRANIGIGDEHDVTVTYTDPEEDADGDPRDDIEEEATFSVVQADISVTPAAAAPGQTISVAIGGMRPYTLIDEIRIGRVSLLGNLSVTTDREGDATVSDITVPYLDPGHYPVTVQVGSDTRVVEFEMLAEAAVTGVAVELPDAVSDLGDNLDAIFHFNNTSKEWTFYDPRPEFAELNTLNELNGGQPYWVLVKDSQEDVDWNGRLVSFTCAGGDCWNLEIW